MFQMEPLTGLTVNTFLRMKVMLWFLFTRAVIHIHKAVGPPLVAIKLDTVSTLSTV